MKVVWFFLSIIAAFIVQSHISLWGVAPDLTLVVAYTVGIHSGSTKGILLGSVVGILEDSVSGNILGPNLLGKGMAGFLASFSSGSLLRWTPLLGVLSLFALTLVDGGVVFLTRTIFETSPASLSRGIFTVLMQGILNSAIGIFIRPHDVD
jgi:rod shape-determining protein MreD